MNKKKINLIISKKVKSWQKSITDDSVRSLAERDTIVTGGSIVSLLLNEEVNDYDIYFKTRETALAVAKYYVSIFNNKDRGKPINAKVIQEAQEDGKIIEGGRIKIRIDSAGAVSTVPDEDDGAPSVADIIEDADDINAEVESPKEYKPRYLTDNAITLSDKIQIVIRFFGHPDEIHRNYDFIHCTNYWTMGTGVVLNQGALESILNKELVYQGSKYPVCSLFRIRKFINRGWFINAGQITKIAFQISDLDLTDIETLMDQLVGVDSAYFMSFIDGLKLAQRDPSIQVDHTYVGSLIDRIF